MRPRSFASGLLVLTALAGCQGASEPPPPPAWIDVDRLQAADQEPGSWLTLGRDFGETHYSPLDLIDAGNVEQLGLAWEYDASPRRGTTPHGLEATPIVVDGVLYTSGPWGVVHALDARTGEEVWRFDPDVDGSYARRACCDVVNRGVAVWKGRVYVATLDGYLVSLDASTGEVEWTADTFIDRSRFYTITAAPRIARDKVIIGNSGGEFGVRGYISAYDVASGEFAWRFFTVPGDPKKGFEHPEMEMASRTWDPNSHWESGGGGTVWGDMVYDPDLDLLYVGTGNSSPYPIWIRSPQGGDNLFLASILALNPQTGRLVWHYQTVPGEIWDYTATQHMILADLELDGATRQVLMQAPKNGFFYVLDRRTGELLSAENFVPVNWASHIDLETGRPVFKEEAYYKDEPKAVTPGMWGAHNWPPMSYSLQTGLVYIPVNDGHMRYSSQPDYEYRPGEANMGAGGAPVLRDGRPDTHKRLVAWDPVTQREAWRTPDRPGLQDGGVLSTGGNLVFQGTASGHFIAYQADTGKMRKTIDVGTGIMAGAMTYALDGEQFIAVMAGLGGAPTGRFSDPDAAALRYQNGGRILAFKLGGGPVPLPPSRAVPETPEPPSIEVSPATLDHGAALYGRHCGRCHGGFGPDHRSNFPDLAAMTQFSYGVFDEIVLGEVLTDRGMASFADVLDEEDSHAIKAFLASRQKELRDVSPAN